VNDGVGSLIGVYNAVGKLWTRPRRETYERTCVAFRCHPSDQ
jgi:hypothetical protein